MLYPRFNANVPRRQKQSLQMLGINLTDDYADGEMESCKNISAHRYPYITTAKKRVQVNGGVSPGYQPVSIYAWEELFVVSNEPSENGGYKCYYGGKYCGDAENLKLPKQYAVVNSKLVMFPDKIYFNLYDEKMKSNPLTSAPQLASITVGNISYVKGGDEDDL